jgi:hypothetical protein
LSKENKEEI